MKASIYDLPHHSEMNISRETLKKRRAKLLKNKTPSQKKAERIVRKIASNLFSYSVIPEQILKPYIVDIFIKPLKIGIEVDGGVHKEGDGYDNRRDEYLMNVHKVSVFRFKNEEVGTDYFKESIWSICCRAKYRELLKIKEKAISSGVEKIFNSNFPWIK